MELERRCAHSSGLSQRSSGVTDPRCSRERPRAIPVSLWVAHVTPQGAFGLGTTSGGRDSAQRCAQLSWKAAPRRGRRALAPPAALHPDVFWGVDSRVSPTLMIRRSFVQTLRPGSAIFSSCSSTSAHPEPSRGAEVSCASLLCLFPVELPPNTRSGGYALTEAFVHARSAHSVVMTLIHGEGGGVLRV